MKFPVALALAGCVLSLPAQAFEVTGGSVALGYSSFTGGDGASEVNKTVLGSSLEFGFTQQAGVQTDIGVTRFGATDLRNLNLGLHGVFHVSDTTSLGAFVGRDTLEDGDLDYVGLELGHQMGAFGTEAWLSHATAPGASGTVLGLKGDYALTDTASLGLRYNNLNVEGFDLSRVSVTGEWAALPGLALTGEVGSAHVEDAGSENFFGLGLKVNFGAKRGATFDQRSVVDLVPGL